MGTCILLEAWIIFLLLLSWLSSTIKPMYRISYSFMSSQSKTLDFLVYICRAPKPLPSLRWILMASLEKLGVCTSNAVVVFNKLNVGYLMIGILFMVEYAPAWMKTHQNGFLIPKGGPCLSLDQMLSSQSFLRFQFPSYYINWAQTGNISTTRYASVFCRTSGSAIKIKSLQYDIVDPLPHFTLLQTRPLLSPDMPTLTH